MSSLDSLIELSDIKKIFYTDEQDESRTSGTATSRFPDHTS